jgi:hypothetical protein
VLYLGGVIVELLGFLVYWNFLIYLLFYFFALPHELPHETLLVRVQFHYHLKFFPSET